MCSSTGRDWGSSSPECLGSRATTASGSILKGMCIRAAPKLLEGDSASTQNLPGQKHELGAERALGKSTQKRSDPSPRHGLNPSRALQLRVREEANPSSHMSTHVGTICARLGESCPWSHPCPHTPQHSLGSGPGLRAQSSALPGNKMHP